MVKKNASLAGRGVEILFGTDSRDDEETSNSEETPSVVIDMPVDEADSVAETDLPGSEEEPGMDAVLDLTNAEPIDPEWAAMMEAEASSAESAPGSEGEPAPAVSGEGVTVWPSAPYANDVVDLTGGEDRPAAPEPEEAMASLAMAQAGESDEALGLPGEALDTLATAPIGESADWAVGEPSAWDVPAQEPGPLSGAATPASGTYTPPVSSAVSEPPPADLPSPRDKSGEAQLAQRIESLRISGTLYDSGVKVGSGAELLPETPEMADLHPEVIEDYERDQASRVRDEKEVIEYVGFKQRQKLWDEIDALYDQVPEVLSTYEEQKDALRLLRESQDILMEKPRQYDIAKYKVSQVKTILKRRNNITKWTDGLAWFIFGYDVLWIILLLYLVFFVNLEPLLRTTLGLVDPLTTKEFLNLDNLLRLWNTLLWGGIGGVANGFYGLFRHASQKKDFDRQYLMWYIAQPVVGFLLGLVIHLIIGTGFLSATGADTTGQEAEIISFPSLVAWLAGFRQEFVLKLIDGIIRLLTPGSSDTGSSSSGTDLGAEVK